MTQLGDFYVKEPSNPEDGGWGRNRLVGLGVLLLLALTLGFCWFSGDGDEAPPEPQLEEGPPPPAASFRSDRARTGTR